MRVQVRNLSFDAGTEMVMIELRGDEIGQMQRDIENMPAGDDIIRFCYAPPGTPAKARETALDTFGQA